MNLEIAMRIRLAMPFRQSRLGIGQIDMTGPAMLEQTDDGTSFPRTESGRRPRFGGSGGAFPAEQMG
jgi:hypothetical protein